MKIALDAMGSEHSPIAEVEGAVAAAKENINDIVLVGKKDAIEAEFKKYRCSFPIVEANQVIVMSDHPSEVMRDKRDSSISVGMRLVKNKEADAFVSAGNTGAVMTAATLILGRIEGIERPAISIVIALPGNTFMLLDAGANANCKPEYLVQFAQMGSVYMERLFGVKNPRIGLIANGEEETKGNTLTCETHQLLKASKLNFIGNIEGNDLPYNKADVIVTDGFTGNVMLKVGEGVGELIVRAVKTAIAQRPYLKPVALLLKPTLRSAFKAVDYSEYGGAPLLGVNGNVIIAHGRSDAKAIKNALSNAKRVVEQDIVNAIHKGIH
jgi:glycerol-3-phosphate acyltransferase PlsX